MVTIDKHWFDSAGYIRRAPKTGDYLLRRDAARREERQNDIDRCLNCTQERCNGTCRRYKKEML